MTKLSTPPAWIHTPRTNAIIQDVQSTNNPFDVAFWRLLELTRILEIENNKLKQSKKPNAQSSRQAKQEVVARKKQGRPKAKMARKS